MTAKPIQTSRGKYPCPLCFDEFNSKKAFVEHLIGHYEDGSDEADRAEQKLDDLVPNGKWRNY